MPGLLPPFMRRNAYSWLYTYLAKRIRWGSTPTLLEQYALIVSLLAIVLTGILLGISWLNDLEEGFWLVAGVGVLLFVIVDIASVAFGITMTQSQSVNRDLIRLSPITPAHFVESMWQAAQTQTWRILVVMQAIRLTLLIVGGILAVPMLVFIVAFTFGGGLLWIASWLFLIVSEPIWRLQAMTAIGIYSGIGGESTTTRWLTGLGLMVAVWLAQGAIALIPIGITRSGGDTGILFWLTIILPAMTFAIRWSQLRIRDLCLGRAGVLFANTA